jgi:DNA-binding MarR family transcriptional regulator
LRVLDPAELRAWRDATFYRLVFRASRAERMMTLQRLHERGWHDVTLNDTALLANLDTEGTTISALARRTGVTRQAASQQVAALEREGYVTRKSDRRDARAIVVRQTARGRKLLADALDIVKGIEAEYAQHLGVKRLDALKKELRALLDHIDPEGTLGQD